MNEHLQLLLASFRPGQRVTPATLRLLFARQRWDASQPGVRSLSQLLQDDREIHAYLEHSPELHGIYFQGRDGSVYVRRLRPEERTTVYIDVNNLVWSFNSAAPRAAHLHGLCTALRRYGVRTIHAVADANLPYVIADPENLPDVVAAADLWEYAERGTVADRRIVALARERPGWIASNDRFREWKRLDGWSRANLWRLVVPVVFVPPDGCDLGSVGEELLSP